MHRIGRSCRGTLRFRSLVGIGLAGIGLAVTGCGGGGASAVNAPPASAHTAAERAAVTSWFVQTNQMLDQERLPRRQPGHHRPDAHRLPDRRTAGRPANADRMALQLSGLSIIVPCHTGSPTVFVAYADTDVFDLGSSVQSVAMVFERAAACGSWPRPSTTLTAVQAGRRCARKGRPRWRRPCSRPESLHLRPGAGADPRRERHRADHPPASPFAVNDFLRPPARSPRCPPPRSGRTGRAESGSPAASPRHPARRSRCRWPTAAATG